MCRYFELRDLYVGKTVNICAQPFEIVRADEHCLQYLEDLARRASALLEGTPRELGSRRDNKLPTKTPRLIANTCDDEDQLRASMATAAQKHLETRQLARSRKLRK